MAYNTGICNSFDELKTALINCCVSNGWTSDTDSAGKDVIYKDNLYVMLEVLSDCFRITGRTGINTGSSPCPVGITNFYPDGSKPCPGSVIFPVAYYCFTYNDVDEVYFIIKYANMYQWIAFGKSNMTLPGTGLWVAGTAGLIGSTYDGSNRPKYINTSVDGYVSATRATSASFFWMAYSDYSSSWNYRNYWLHSNINASYPWSLALDNYYYYPPIGIKYLTARLSGQPNEFNQQSLLLPVLAYHTSATYSGQYTLVAHIQKARHLMINYLDPETILYHGSEQWVVFPYLKKVYVSPYTTSLTYSDHTGNFGWAIKKEA